MNTADIEVLHREPGYLRLRLPPSLRNATTGKRIEAGLSALSGVQRVTLLSSEGRLAVRFNVLQTTHAAIAVKLKSLLADHPQVQDQTDIPLPAEAVTVGLGERFAEIREKLIAAAPGRFRPLVESATTEKAVTNFFNDIVAFYLIRTHWDLITRHWIKDPVKFSNAWLTVFYLVFLLVRYRKS